MLCVEQYNEMWVAYSGYSSAEGVVTPGGISVWNSETKKLEATLPIVDANATSSKISGMKLYHNSKATSDPFELYVTAGDTIYVIDVLKRSIKKQFKVTGYTIAAFTFVPEKKISNNASGTQKNHHYDLVRIIRT